MAKISFNELNLDNLAQWPMPIKISVVAGMGFLIIALGYWLIVADNFAEYKILQTEETKLKKDLENKQHQVYNLDEYRLQLKIMNLRFSSLLKELPAKNEMPGLLEEISKTGIASGLKFELFAPQPEVVHDFYVELPIKISVVGNYFQLAEFISRVAEMSRIVTLHEFSIVGESSKDQKTNSEDQLLMSITAKIYRYRI